MNPQNLKEQTVEQANNNPMVAGFITPTDGTAVERRGGPSGISATNSASFAGDVSGVSASFMSKVMSAESGGRANAKASTSSATGLFQFIEGTWKGLMKKYPNLGLTPDGRTNPEQQKRAMAQFTKDNETVLRKAGLPVTEGTLYLAHFAGAGGAKAILDASADTPVEKLLKPEAVKANSFLAGKTAGWVVRWAERKMNK
jgi:hypothetical protein